MKQFQGSDTYIASPELVRSVNIAAALQKPLLIKGEPGTGKTMLLKAFARTVGSGFKRIQFTPDVVPSDVTGFTMYEKQTGRFIYRPGAVMCNMLLADEINRTSSKTQAALLEVMEEGKVTVDN